MGKEKREQIYFVYGNQPLDLKEKREELIRSLVPAELLEESVFRFDTGDFYAKGKAEGEELLQEFQSTCETVSFFTPQIVIDLENLQKIKVGKSTKGSLEKILSEIELIEVLAGENVEWHEATSKAPDEQVLSRIKATFPVNAIVPYSGKRFYLELREEWKNRAIFSYTKGSKKPMSLQEFLRGRIKEEVHFFPINGEEPLEEFSGSFISTLKSYIENPPQQVFLICSALVRKPGELAGKLDALLKKNAKTIKTLVTYDEFMPVDWVVKRANAKKMQMDRITADLFIQLAGNDLETLDMELTKLALYVGEGATLSPETVVANVSHSKVANTFQISEHLANRNLQKATECLELVLGENPSDAIGLFGLISSQFRRLLKIAWLRKSHLEDQSIISFLGINPWFGSKILAHLDNYSLEELENIVIHLSKIDLQVKYAGQEALQHLKNLCFQICQREFITVKHIESHWIP